MSSKKSKSKSVEESLSKKRFKTIIENTDDNDNTKRFKRLLNLYMQNSTKFIDNYVPEFEVRFGTKKIKSLTKIDFYNVIRNILGNGFKMNTENYTLKVISDSETSNIRTQISGFPNIQSYCKFNNISNIEDKGNLEFIEKDYFKNDGVKIYPLDFDEFNFRVSFQVEKIYQHNDIVIENIMSNWQTTKKIFRYIKRYEYTHPELPFLIHCSIVKTSKTNLGKFIPEFNIKDSDVFNSLEHYEIEIELNNTLIGINTRYETGVLLYDDLKKVIKMVLVGLQQTNFPIAISEKDAIHDNYLKITKNRDYDPTKKQYVNVKDFIGPSSATLQMINLLQDYDINDTNKSIPNIRHNYTVTDKADGMRKLLFIAANGKIYLITTLMNIEFTGCYIEDKELFNTIIDGEHIINDKHGEYINLFAAFDLYFINTKNTTGLPFVNTDILKEKEKQKAESKKKVKDKGSKQDDEEKKEKKDKEGEEEEEEKVDVKAEELNKYRLNLLNSVIKKLNLKSVIGAGHKCDFKISIKKFYSNNIFNGCASILNNVKENLYEYNTDGLIFTPANTGVASDKLGVLAPNYKTTWNQSFKWKPSEFNTIDFLVKFSKNEYNVNKIGTISNDGFNATSINQTQTYYILNLYVGFDEKKHGYINPCNDIINDYVNLKKEFDTYKDSYKPAKFYPTNPSDENAYICHILGSMDDSNNLRIYTEEGEQIEDNTIVEFKYDITKPEFWRWIPLRVRTDKTAELRSGVKNFGNAYHVANSNWQSIHNPITEKIITSGEYIKSDNADDDVYYNKITNTSETRSLRDFHNLYVKNMLLNRVSNMGDILIDYACGKGGDLPKWINSNYQFVLGIDLNKDNIENRMDGACARYLNYAKKNKSIPKALFLNGNSSVNIKNGDAFATEKNKQIIKAIFGEGTKNELTLGKGVYKNYGIASNGFNISSIQFAIHYMFESEIILNEFLQNISQCTALEGYFIGTCYDGNKVFNMLKDKQINESISLFKNDKKIWEITKKYSNGLFEDDENCIGYGIDVYQESINKTFREYLVNFNYLIRLLENYGFVLLTDDEIKSLNLLESIGSFEKLYNNMLLEIKKDKRLENKIGNAVNMSEEEKKISFLNNYFVFKKLRNVSDKISDIDKEKEEEELKEEFKTIDEKVESIKKSEIDEESQKLKEKYISQTDDKSIKDDEEKLSKKSKIKASIEEKLRLAEEKSKSKKVDKPEKSKKVDKPEKSKKVDKPEKSKKIEKSKKSKKEE